MASIKEYEDKVKAEAEAVLAEAHQVSTMDTRYESGINALCQKLDRILSGESDLSVSSVVGERSLGPAMTQFSKRIKVQLDHKWIERWVRKDANGRLDTQDRIGLTLSLNLHELGHVLYSPRVNDKEETYSKGRQLEEMTLFNALEDQRQEMLVSLEYPKATDYFRMCNTRALREALVSFARKGQPVPHQLLLLYFGRRHLFPTDVNAMLVKAFLADYTQTDLEFVKSKIKLFMGLTLTSKGSMEAGWDIVSQLLRFWTRPQGSLNPFNSGCMPQEGGATRTQAEQKSQVEKLQKSLKKQEANANAETKQATSGKPKQAEKSEKSEQAEKAEAEGGSESEVESPEEAEGGTEGESEGSEEGTGSKDGKPESSKSTEEESESGSSGQGGGKGTRKMDLDVPQSAPEELKQAVQELLESETETEEKVSTEVHDYEQSVFSSGKLSLGLSLQQTAQSLARLLDDIATDLREQNFRNQPSGRFDLHGLAGKIASGSDKLFYRKQEDLSNDASMAIHIAVDVSGSMRDGKSERAVQAAYTIAKAAEMTGHKTRITAFNQDIVPVKGWYSTRIYEPSAGGDTQPLPIFKSALKDFRMLEVKDNIHNHVMIVITDGGWGDATGCQLEITKLRKAGVYVILIGIDYSPSRSGHKYEDCYATLVVRNVTDLTQVMRETLKKLAIQIGHDAVRKSW